MYFKRKLKEYVIIPNQDIIESLSNMVRSNKSNIKYRIVKPKYAKLNTKRLKQRYPIKKQNSLYTMAIFKDEKPKDVPLHTIAIFEPNADTNHIILSNPLNIDLPPDQFIVPELDEDTREGEVFLNNESFENWVSQGENADSYQVDESLNQEYQSVDENNVDYFPINDSYFPDSSNDHLNQAQYEDNFAGYPQSHQSTSTTEHSGYSYEAPSYLPPEESDGVLFDSSGAGLVPSNDTKVAKIKEHDLFSRYYIGYKLWYVALLFGIYHVIMVIFFFLTILSKHYSRFPAALQAAAANSYNS